MPNRTASDKALCDTAFNIIKHPKYDGYQRRIASVVYKFFWSKNSGGGNKNENMTNQELAE